MKPAILIALTCAAVTLPLCGDTVTVSATTDTWLYSGNPDANESGDFHGLAAGLNNAGSPMHAMIQFDLTQIPTNATVTSATVTLVALKQNFSASSATFELHRLTTPWVGSQATWNSSQTGVAWSAPGATGTTDCSSTPSASTLVTGAFGAQYNFGPTDGTLADVQAWVNNPASNQGWLLKVNDESVATTARRWGSIATGSPASLSVTYTVSTPPAQPVISSAITLSGQFQFAFNAQPNVTYTVETRPAFDASTWTTLTTFPASPVATNYAVSDSIAPPARFYRVKTP